METASFFSYNYVKFLTLLLNRWTWMEIRSSQRREQTQNSASREHWNKWMLIWAQRSASVCTARSLPSLRISNRGGGGQGGHRSRWAFQGRGARDGNGRTVQKVSNSWRTRVWSTSPGHDCQANGDGSTWCKQSRQPTLMVLTGTNLLRWLEPPMTECNSFQGNMNELWGCPLALTE